MPLNQNLDLAVSEVELSIFDFYTNAPPQRVRKNVNKWHIHLVFLEEGRIPKGFCKILSFLEVYIRPIQWKRTKKEVRSQDSKWPKGKKKHDESRDLSPIMWDVLQFGSGSKICNKWTKQNIKKAMWVIKCLGSKENLSNFEVFVLSWKKKVKKSVIF